MLRKEQKNMWINNGQNFVKFSENYKLIYLGIIKSPRRYKCTRNLTKAHHNQIAEIQE